MNYQEALDMALRKEKASIETYRKFSVDPPVLRDLFDFLINEEEKHVLMIEKKIADLQR